MPTLLNTPDNQGDIMIIDDTPNNLRVLSALLDEHGYETRVFRDTQIDSIYLDKYSNALINLYENAIQNPAPFIAQICLVQMVRSHTSKWFENAIQGGQK